MLAILVVKIASAKYKTLTLGGHGIGLYNGWRKSEESSRRKNIQVARILDGWSRIVWKSKKVNRLAYFHDLS